MYVTKNLQSIPSVVVMRASWIWEDFSCLLSSQINRSCFNSQQSFEPRFCDTCTKALILYHACGPFWSLARTYSSLGQHIEAASHCQDKPCACVSNFTTKEVMCFSRRTLCPWSAIVTFVPWKIYTCGLWTPHLQYQILSSPCPTEAQTLYSGVANRMLETC